ncbi:MAG: MlaD family protein [candidate division KSB1 bacterium]|nr:MlaD family protein [candidate division KSB1 bacterium]MDZ7367994.1 MlaD family protein [candidate division KSB1 bacterium]MDZ7405617.1 MlaD family protein [candidate division KSB1 bacterium]
MRKNAEFIVGLTVVLGLAILLFGILWGKNYRLASNQVRVSFLFQNTGGLRVNDPVTVNGVPKGQVVDIRLQQGGVRVEVKLDGDVQLYSDVSAYITTVEMMGGKKVEIIPGTSGQPLDLITRKTPLKGSQTAGFSEMMLEMSKIAARSHQLMQRLDSTITLASTFLDDDTIRRPLIVVLNDLQASTATMRQFVQTNQAAMQKTMDNVQITSTHIRSLAERHSPQLDSTFLALNRTIYKLDAFANTLDEISLRLQQRQGNLSKLIYDDETYQRLNTTIAKVDSTVVDLRKHLGRFLHGSNFNLINLLSF